MSRRLTRAGVVLAASAATVAVGVLPASAHIRVSSPDASQGSSSVLTFRVPTEKDTASTTSIQVFMPADQPLSFVAAQTHPGWTAQVHKRTLAQPLQTADGPVTEVVNDVVWTADSPTAAIGPGQFDQFAVLAGPLPHVAALSMPATQTYSDGEVVTWNEVAAPGAPEPEHPAPSLKLAAGTGATGSMPGMPGMGSASSSAGGPTVSADAPPTPAAGSDAALPVAISALIVALLSVLGLATALVRGRRSTGAAPASAHEILTGEEEDQRVGAGRSSR